jgi:hypothetical protein
MKKVSKYFLLILLAGLSVSVISCNKDEEPEPLIDDRDIMLGKWKCQENSSQSGNNPPFNVEIQKSPADNARIDILNFYGIGTAVCNVSGSYISIPSQNINGNTCKGGGTSQSHTTIHLSYTAFDGSNIDSVTAVLTKQ